VTYIATNGSATGCSVSGAVLSIPTNVSGTCLVTASQASFGSYLPDSSTVTTVNFFWNYTALWAIASYNYGYVCDSGGTLSGTTCTVTSTYGATYAVVSYNYGYTCPSGGALSGTTCWLVSTSAASSYETSGYYCSSGWSGPSGTTCYRYAVISHASCSANGGTWLGSECELYTAANYGTDGGAFGLTYYCTIGLLSGTLCYTYPTYAATYAVVSYNYGYTCPSGGTLSGTTCTVTTTYTATYAVVSYNYGYMCPSGGTLGGTTCTVSGGSGPNLRRAFVVSNASTSSESASAPMNVTAEVQTRGRRVQLRTH
jgi:hypothetical protein